MSINYTHLSTGLKELDKILKGLLPGDNIVWQVSQIEDYQLFVTPFYQNALQVGQKIIYFRFAKHSELINDNSIEIEKYILNPESGFETFINEIHYVIEKHGNSGFYIFDCLTDLAADWYSDQMLSNFFMLTCPYLLDIETLAYFALFKNKHSSNALQPISETTQIFLDTFHHNNELYIHPIKVQKRYSPTMHFLHLWKDNNLIPVTKSITNSEIFTSIPWLGQESASHVFDIWNRTLLDAEYLLEQIHRGEKEREKEKKLLKKIIRMMVSRDEKIVHLIEKYMTLEDILNISKRMIGTGLIGGKSIGMLLARAILKDKNKNWDDILEVHDSFYIGSDVFYTYLVKNGCWWVRQQKDLEIYLHNAKHARRLILTGQFPEYIVKKFIDLLSYFGQSPIIVRSSSLLEDNFGNAFSGKYESIFCPNQGPREKCLEDFMTAIRTIYASTMSEKALKYRAQCGMLDRDEQMSLLVQRVSGSLNNQFFYPLVAGVGYSYNPYVWSEYIDAKSGLIRLVFGLGTRAVDRTDDDYTRIVALNAPDRRPEENDSEVRKFSQKKVDVIDLESNQLVTVPFEDVAKKSNFDQIDMIATRDYEMERRASSLNIQQIFSWLITFDKLFKETNFIDNMRSILQTLENAYKNPVDIEFTVNIVNSKPRINIVQCRPFQAKDSKAIRELNFSPENNDIILKSSGPVIGQNKEDILDRIIYVVPSIYSSLSISDRYSIARIIGKINHLTTRNTKVLLIGPGRWGTTTPSLGVPVSFSEISRISFLCEIVMMRDDLIPDVSLGTHFFNDLVEFDIVYLALYPDNPNTIFNQNFFLNAQLNDFSEEIPEFNKYNQVIKVIDAQNMGNNKLLIYTNSLKQQVLCYQLLE